MVVAIDKFACVECKTIIKQHTAALNAWANNNTDAKVSATTKEALLDLSARLHEVIEQLPVEETKH